MTLKKERVRCGKAIRALTGLKLPDAMRIAKAASKDIISLSTGLPGVVDFSHMCGDSCKCVYPMIKIIGPKGEVVFSGYCIGIDTLKLLQKVPKTVVSLEMHRSSFVSYRRF